MLMLVSVGNPRTRQKQWLQMLLFWVFTLIPFVALIWLLWPRR